MVSTVNRPNFGQKSRGDCAIDRGICSYTNSDLVSSAARPESKARLEGTVKRDNCHWHSQHSYSLLSGPAIPSGGFWWDKRMSNRISLDLFLESKNNNNICRLIMDARICSEIKMLLKSCIFISSGDITVTLFLLEFREMQIS